MVRQVSSLWLKDKILKYMKHIKNYNESLSESSKGDLIDLKNELEFLSEFDNVSLHEVIEVIDTILNMKWEDIEEWREHLETNHRRDDKDNLTIRLIDRFCSNIEDN